MIEFVNVTISYPDAAAPVLRDVSLRIEEGELGLVAGRTGAGKSSLLGAINGLVPHFTGGTMSGRVVVAGRDTRTHRPRDLAEVVGVVGQDPLAGFVTDTVEEELAYGMEQLATPAEVMRKRVEETLDLLGIAELRHRPLRTLSGGQQQRVAIGAALTTHPAVLVLDEPTSALDPTAAEEVLATITRLVHDLGTTVVLAEHRLERVIQYVDRMLLLRGDGTVRVGSPADLLVDSPVAPPVVELGRLVGWAPLPLSVRAARRVAGPVRDRLAGRTPPPPPPSIGTVVAHVDKLSVAYGAVVALRAVSLSLRAGEATAVMGRNGSGKSTLLWALHGAGRRRGGTVRLADDVDPATLPARQVRHRVGLVPQTPADLLYLTTVRAECAQADRESRRPAGTCRARLDALVPGIDDDLNPADLSEGQRLALVLAIQLTAAPPVVLLDEPTRGLDYLAKRQLTTILRDLAGSGHAVVVATHDVEFVAATADRVVVLGEGEVVADGPAAEVVVASPAFAPQVSKILGPWLTVAQVGAALGETG